MQRIFHAIRQGHYPNRVKLAKEIEVTTKTIQRDIDFMRDRWNLPIAYNDERHGYELSEPVQNFPMVELTEGELISVFVAQKALCQYKGTPFEQPLRSAFDKLVSGLQGTISLSWNDLDSFFSFRSFEIVQTDIRTFQVVSEAVRRSEVLTFEYRKLDALTFERRTIEPYHLACIQDQWYCFGYDIDRRKMRTYVLARMRRVLKTVRTFSRSKSFRLESMLKDSLGVFEAKGRFDIKLRFDRFAAQLVRERIWHSSQQIQELTGGEIEFRLVLSSLHEIEPWIMSWGEHATVVSPRELIGRIQKRYRSALRLLR